VCMSLKILYACKVNILRLMVIYLSNFRHFGTRSLDITIKKKKV
jgi:hypothetical protein